MSQRRSATLWWVAWWLVLVAATGCHRPREGGDSLLASAATPQASAGSPVASSSSSTYAAAPSASNVPTPATPALQGEPLQELVVEGFQTAVASLPLGTREPRPVVLALHGNYDRPEWQCEVWRAITRGRVWVLCPRGVPRGDAPKRLDRWTYAGADKLELEVRAGLAALAAAYPEYVDVERPLFTGFSLGAILGVRLLSRTKQPLNFPAAVLVEGGYKGWSHGTAKGFREQGGRRLLFACGQSACRHASKQASRVLSQHEVLTDTVSGGDIGHTYDGAVAEAIQGAWAWVTADDERFATREHED